MKTKLIWLAIIAIVIVGIVWLYQSKQFEDRGLILFYREDCPHCKKVEAFISENKIDEKIKIVKKEVKYNQTNIKNFADKFTRCSIDANQAGVPLLWDGSDDKCYVGDQPIIDYFKNKLDITTVVGETSQNINK